MRVIVCLSLLLCLVACGDEEEECWDPGWENFSVREADGSPVCMPHPSEGMQRCMTSGSYTTFEKKTELGYQAEWNCTEIITFKPMGGTYDVFYDCLSGNHVSDKCDDWRPYAPQ